MEKLLLVWWPVFQQLFDIRLWRLMLHWGGQRTKVRFAVGTFVSIIIILVSLQCWRTGGYQIVGLQIEYTNCKSEKMGLELKILSCSPVPKRGLAKKLIYKSFSVKYCYSESNTFFYGAGNSVPCFYFLTFLALLEFFYLSLWT